MLPHASWAHLAQGSSRPPQPLRARLLSQEAHTDPCPHKSMTYLEDLGEVGGPLPAHMAPLWKLGKGAPLGRWMLCVRSAWWQDGVCASIWKRPPFLQANVAFCQTDNRLDCGPTLPFGLVPLCHEPENYTWWFAKHFLSLSISTRYYQIRNSVADFLELCVVSHFTPIPIPFHF